MTPADFDKLEALLVEATPGPWQVNGVRQKWRTSYHNMVLDSHTIGPDDKKGWVALFPYSSNARPGTPELVEEWNNPHLVVALVNAAPSLLAAARNAERLRAALEKIADLDIPRAAYLPWRSDGKPSKNDRCEHEVWMYDECSECTANVARAALAGSPE